MKQRLSVSLRPLRNRILGKEEMLNKRKEKPIRCTTRGKGANHV